MKANDMKRLEKRLKGISADKILDVATGRGEFIAMMMPSLGKFNKFVGIDSEERAIAFSNQQFKDAPVEAIKMDAQKMDFADGEFDIVAISNSVHHMDRPKRVINEMLRVTKPEGLIFISEMFRDGDQSKAQKNHVFMHHWCAQIDRRVGIPHHATYSRERLERFAGSLGLEDIEFYLIDYKEKAPVEAVEKTIAILDPYHERIKNHPDYVKLGIEKERIKKRLIRHGLGSSARLFIIGKKPVR